MYDIETESATWLTLRLVRLLIVIIIEFHSPIDLLRLSATSSLTLTCDLRLYPLPVLYRKSTSPAYVKALRDPR